MYILKGPLFWQDQRKVSNNCKKIEFQLFSFLEINEFLFHTFVCHHILMKWFIFCRLCLCYCWNIAKNRNLLLFLWFQKIGPFKMYMALRTLQKNFMSPIFDTNSSLPFSSFGVGNTLEVAKTLYPSNSLDLLAVCNAVWSRNPNFFSESASWTRYFHGSAMMN